jgi:hypothetical protein
MPLQIPRQRARCLAQTLDRDAPEFARLRFAASVISNVKHQSPGPNRAWNQPHAFQNHRRGAPLLLTSLYCRQEVTGKQQKVLGPLVQNGVRKDHINISTQTRCNIALICNWKQRLFTADTLYGDASALSESRNCTNSGQPIASAMRRAPTASPLFACSG